MFVISYWNIEQNISGFLSKIFLQVCKNSILPLHTKSLGKFFSDTFTALHRSWTLSECFPAIFGFFNGVVNTVFVEPREHLDELLWIENGLLIQVWTCAENFLAYYKKFTIGLSKLYYTCRKDQTGKKIRTFLFLIVFGHCAKLVWPLVKVFSA